MIFHIYGLRSGSKRNRPNYDKAIQGQKNQVPQEKKSTKLEIQAHLLSPIPVLPQIMVLNGLFNL
jgi:hypothetical protein